MTLYGRTGTIVAQPGQRDALAALLLGVGNAGMKGCRLYLIAASEDDADALVITEVWDSADDHKASLGLPQVGEMIGKARPLIASMSGQGLAVLGGIGLPR